MLHTRIGHIKRPPFLDVINHAGFVVFFTGCGKPTAALLYDWLLNVIANILRFSRIWLHPTGIFSLPAFGVEDGRALAALLPPTNLPDVSNQNTRVCLPAAS